MSNGSPGILTNYAHRASSRVTYFARFWQSARRDDRQTWNRVWDETATITGLHYGRGMSCDVEVEDTTTVMCQNDKHEQNLEP